MLSKALKQGLGLALAMAVLAGCSSTDTTDEAANTGSVTDSSVSAGGADTGVGVNAGVDESGVTLSTVFYFEFDSSVLNAEARAALLAHAEALKASGASVRLEGHADERGTREYNMALGERRANAVRDFLVIQGVSASGIETVSYGEEYPAVVGSTESSYSQNRRVELKK